MPYVCLVVVCKCKWINVVCKWSRDHQNTHHNKQFRSRDKTNDKFAGKIWIFYQFFSKKSALQGPESSRRTSSKYLCHNCSKWMGQIPREGQDKKGRQYFVGEKIVLWSTSPSLLYLWKTSTPGKKCGRKHLRRHPLTVTWKCGEMGNETGQGWAVAAVTESPECLTAKDLATGQPPRGWGRGSRPCRRARHRGCEGRGCGIFSSCKRSPWKMKYLIYFSRLRFRTENSKASIQNQPGK